MSGLGDALQLVGGNMMEIGKEQRLEKMRQEQENRAEEREKRREERAYQRELKKAQGQPRIVDRNGKKVMQYRNAEGTVIREEEVDAYTLEQLGRDEQKAKLGIESLLNEVELGDKKLADYDSDKQLDRKYREAQIAERFAARDENIAQAEASRRKGLEGRLATDSASDSQLAVELVQALPDLKKQYTEGDEPIMTAEEYHHLAQGSIIEAEKRGVDAVTLFRSALRGRKLQKERANKD